MSRNTPLTPLFSRVDPQTGEVQVTHTRVVNSDHGQYVVTSTHNPGSLQQNSDGILHDGNTAVIWRDGVLITIPLRTGTAASIHSTNRSMTAGSNFHPESKSISSTVQPSAEIMDVRMPKPPRSLFRRRGVGNVPSRIGEDEMFSTALNTCCSIFNVLQEEWASFCSTFRNNQTRMWKPRACLYRYGTIYVQKPGTGL